LNPSPTDWPPVTVNVLAYNRRDDVRRTLRAIFSELDYPADRLEVIVVDNASKDETAEMVRSEFPAATVLSRDHNVGVSGWNDGFRAGGGDFFLVLDDDCYITGDALKLAVSAALEEQADLVSFRVTSPWHENFAFNEFWRTGLLAFWGCSVLISGRAVAQLGGFDPRIFIWAHEVDFTARALDAGFRHLYLPEVESVHLKPLAATSARENAAHFRNIAYFAARSLRVADAVGAIANLTCRVAINSVKRPQDARKLFGLLIAGTWLGSRHRSPLRAEVSRLYRRNYYDFISLLRIVRGVRERLRPSPPAGDGHGLGTAPARVREFYERRADIYPLQRSSLRL